MPAQRHILQRLIGVLAALLCISTVSTPLTVVLNSGAQQWTQGSNLWTAQRSGWLSLSPSNQLQGLRVLLVVLLTSPTRQFLEDRDYKLFNTINSVPST